MARTIFSASSRVSIKHLMGMLFKRQLGKLTIE
nr:MAG TPA_asm: hypothetical protein [Caudoviricetes sp.]